MTEANKITLPHVGILPLNASTVAMEEYLETDNGVFQLQSIAGDKFRLLPKGMYTPCEDKSALYRTELVKTVVEGLETTHKDHNRPGVYVQGPEGAGKSFLLYTVTQIAKFKLNWITVYIPNCRHWVTMNPTEAKGFFLDRVLDAFSVRHLQEKFPEFYSLLRKPPKPREAWGITDTARHVYRKLRGLTLPHQEREEAEAWYDAANTDADKVVVAMYKKARSFLMQRHEDSPVLLVFDEVNALWPEGVTAAIHAEPWCLAMFDAPKLNHGALLVSGTTDCEFIDKGIPAGANEILVSVGPLDLTERNDLLKTQEFEVLRDLKILDEGLWQNVVDASGNIPRELKKFCTLIRAATAAANTEAAKVATIEAAKRPLPANSDEDEANPRKRPRMGDLKAAVKNARTRNVADHSRKLDKALSKDALVGVFKSRLSESCRSVFIYGTPARVDKTTLRVPNWVISSDGAFMHPTTVDVQAVYFKWFQTFGENKDDDHKKLLDAISTLSSESCTGGERGNAFERLFTSKLTTTPDFTLSYRMLRYTKEEFCTDLIKTKLTVARRVFKYAADPPVNFQTYSNDTLCTHMDQHGGETRVDLIHYRHDRVIYIELTVADYLSKKIPASTGTTRENAILGSVQKWLGDNTFEVTLEKVDGADHRLETSQKKLVAKYKKRSGTWRPDPPELLYIVATTCPRTVKLSKVRTVKSNWIGMCFLEDLIEAGVIPVYLRDSITAAQSKHAGRME